MDLWEVKDNMKKFSLPGVYSHKDINLFLISLIREHPEYFYDDVDIDACYGVFPFCIFDQ